MASESAKTRLRPRDRLFRVIVIVLLFGLFEAMAFTVFQLNLSLIRERTYDYPMASRDEFERDRKQRDPILGWPGRNRFGGDLTTEGARRSPANQNFSEEDACVSLYGNSFTYSSEVEPPEAWGNVLAELLDCRVDNWGIGGYGVDQAVLRFIENPHQGSDIVILGIYPYGLLRNLTRWLVLISPSDHSRLRWKPTIVERDGQPTILPAPDLTFEDYQDLVEEPQRHLTEEYFIPGEGGPVVIRFPYSLSLLRLAWKIFDELSVERIQKYPTSPERWNRAPWYQKNDLPIPQVVEKIALIIDMFVAQCHEKDIRCVVLIIPDFDSIENHVEDGSTPLRWVYAPFEHKVEVWDATPFLDSLVAKRDVCHYIGANRDCQGHYNAEGYAALARFVHRKLTTPSPPTP